MTPRVARLRLYLDVDGVIVLDTDPRTPGLQSASLIHRTGTGQKHKYVILFSPEILAELANIVREFEVELVWLTSWLRDGLILQLVEALGTLRGGRLLPIPQGRLSGGLPDQWKLRALLKDQRNQPGPFIWADDEHQHFTTKAREKIGVDCLVLKPHPDEGLVTADLEAMRRFLETIPR